ncbi:VPLPA-CTERM sorting domain-containing protein [Cognatiyoonia sediminum]|uniref:VPLPA-CTERM sorting domain-containing protein n=1 Tax=Cognatiyoonia sediminum TaxID=1508389 RepID=UPI00104270C1|nr:VPLPA-CTERM sorting domain-containing protein [Cognatiyoonia sediminum]
MSVKSLLVTSTILASTSLSAVLLPGSGATAATFDAIYIESTDNRPGSTGDISGANDLGLIADGSQIGIAGRIVSAEDMWRFQTDAGWVIGFVDLPIDDQLYFDSSNITNPIGDFADNADTTTAIFSIFDASDNSLLFSNTISAAAFGVGTQSELDYSGTAGSFLLRIDGQDGSPGATYDIGISTVPLPGAVWLLLAGVGGLAAMKRRKNAN